MAVQEIRSLCQLHRPMVVFLSETRLFHDKVEVLQRALGFPHGVGVGSFGHGGGLALPWTRDVDLKLKIMIKCILMPRSSHWAPGRSYGDSLDFMMNQRVS